METTLIRFNGCKTVHLKRMSRYNNWADLHRAFCGHLCNDSETSTGDTEQVTCKRCKEKIPYVERYGDNAWYEYAKDREEVFRAVTRDRTARRKERQKLGDQILLPGMLEAGYLDKRI